MPAVEATGPPRPSKAPSVPMLAELPDAFSR
jgi:hypothetical protein